MVLNLVIPTQPLLTEWVIYASDGQIVVAHVTRKLVEHRGQVVARLLQAVEATDQVRLGSAAELSTVSIGHLQQVAHERSLELSDALAVALHKATQVVDTGRQIVVLDVRHCSN